MKLALIVKRDCETCQLISPLVHQVQAANEMLVYSQDDPQFPSDAEVIDDQGLEYSWRLRINTVPTLILFDETGKETKRLVGWDKAAWEELTRLNFHREMPAFRPGCGSMTQDPGMPEKLLARFDLDRLSARQISLGAQEDDAEACFDRGWSDGLPVIPPTQERVLSPATW